MRCLSLLVVAGVLAGAAALSPAADPKPQAGQWADIKGTVVFPAGKPIPQRAQLNVTQDKAHCLSKGPILDENALVNPKTLAVGNVVVFLRPDNAAKDKLKVGLPKDKIHPDDAKRKPAKVTIDQPVCMFTPRVTVARVGDTIEVLNPAPPPVNHNFFWDSENNGNFNPNIVAGQKWLMPKPLVAEYNAIQYKCSIHPWMTGYVRIFDHPYYAVTDADGKFEIKNAPVGQFRLVYWHENGVKGGAAGRFGDVIQVKAGGTDLGKVEFDVTKK